MDQVKLRHSLLVKQARLQQHLQHNPLQLQKGLQVLEMPHQFKQEQEEWHVQHQNQMEL